MVAKRSSETSLTPGFDTGAMRAEIEQQAETWCDQQASLLRTWQAIADGWFERRQRGLAAARELLRDMSTCQDVAGLAALQQRWLSGVVDRVSADFNAVAESAVAASHENAELMAKSGADLSSLVMPAAAWSAAWQTSPVAKPRAASAAATKRVDEPAAAE